MLELRCGGCGLANAVVDAAKLEKSCCAACEHSLDEDQLVRYHVAESGEAVGPVEYVDLVRRIEAGSLTRATLLSEEGGPWMRAGERADLFPRAAPPSARRAARRRSDVHASLRTHAKAEPIPGPVSTMAVLDFLLGGLLLLLALVGLAIVSSFGGMDAAVGPALLLVVVGLGLIGLGRGLRQRAVIARNIQLGLAVLAGFGLLLLATAGSASLALVAALFVAIPFLLLLPEDIRAWFQGDDADD